MTTTQLQSNETQSERLESPRFEYGRPMLIAGLRGQFRSDTMKEIGTQWERFIPHIGKIPAQIGRVAYGVCFLSASGVDYLSGVEVSSSSGLPADFSIATVPAQRYAVFAHHGHVSTLGQTCDAIEREWLPNSGYLGSKAAAAPNFFERYGESFNPRTGLGDIEVWVAIGFIFVGRKGETLCQPQL
jgi:AraC family transcriptional regulator